MFGSTLLTPAAQADTLAAAADPNDVHWDDRFIPIGPGGGGKTASAGIFFGGELYIGGPALFVKWNGRTFTSAGVPAGIGSGFGPRAFAIYNGELIVGGRFATLDGTTVNSIARWDGSNWQPLGSGVTGPTSITKDVRALVVKDGLLYVGGTFTSAGGAANTQLLATWDGANWAAIASPISGSTKLPAPEVTALEVYGTDLIIGGHFVHAGGSPWGSYLARYDGATTSLFSPTPNSWVYDILADGTDLYITGSFTTVGTMAANLIAKWDGAVWHALGAGLGTLGGTGKSLLKLGGNLYACGNIVPAWGGPANDVARWDGSSWYALGTGLEGASGIVAALVSNGTSGGSNELDGIFALNATSIPDATQIFGRTARWDGSLWRPLGKGVDEIVYALARSGSDYYAGGAFTYAGGAKGNRIAHWDGQYWNRMGDGFSSNVLAVAVASNGDVYAGGMFSHLGDGTTLVNYIARWDGSAWQAMGNGMNAQVKAIAIDGANVYAGGSFTTAGGSPAAHLAVWNGSSWAEVGGGYGDNVNALIYNNGKLFVGGGVTVPFNTWNGSTWDDLGGGVVGAGRKVHAFAAFGNTVYMGGYFAGVGGGSVATNNLAAWNGSIWYAVESVGDFGTELVGALAAGPAGHLYVGGKFTSVGGVPANGLVKWDGSSWSALGSGVAGDFPGGYPYPDTKAISVSSIGHVHVGGNFLSAGAKTAYGFSIYSDPTSPVPTLLQSFDAHARDEGVHLSWSVLNDEGTLAGYRIDRRRGKGPFQVIHNEPLIPPERKDYIDSGAQSNVTYYYRLNMVLRDGSEIVSNLVEVQTASLGLLLEQNHPNPFNPRTTIYYVIPDGGAKASLKILDVRGRLVASLFDAKQTAGRKHVSWDGRNSGGEYVSSGIYFYRLEAGNVVLTKKMVLLK